MTDSAEELASSALATFVEGVGNKAAELNPMSVPPGSRLPSRAERLRHACRLCLEKLTADERTMLHAMLSKMAPAVAINPTGSRPSGDA